MSLPAHTALVEFSTSHLLCLPSQVHFLKSAGITVDLFLSSRTKGLVSHLPASDSIHFLDVENGLRGRLRTVTELYRMAANLGIQAIVFNTAEGNHVRDYCLLPGRGIRYAGILHHTNKLRASFTQRVISTRVRRYYVLMDYLLPALPPSSSLRVSSFTPIIQPAPEVLSPKKPPHEFWVCIPGELEFRRRNYLGLLEELRRTRPDPALRFIALGSADGPDGTRFAELLRSTGLEEQWVFFPGFVPEEVFGSVLLQADVILPLTDPYTQIYANYRYHQVSGSFLQALAYARPMVLDRSWETVRDFSEISLFYDQGECVALLNRWAADRGPLGVITERFARGEKFSVQTQQERYLRLLE